MNRPLLIFIALLTVTGAFFAGRFCGAPATPVS